MEHPQLPQGWIKEALRTNYKRLGDWAKEKTARGFGSPIDIARVPELARSMDPNLPWKEPTPITLQHAILFAMEGCINAIPLLGSRYIVSEIGIVHHGKHRFKQKQATLAKLRRRREVYIHIVASTFAITGIFGWMAWKGILPYHRLISNPKGRDFGEAGTLLGLV
jgi:hypothetical protein